MAEWQLINITSSNSRWTKASAQAMAEAMNGTVKMAYADLGITRIYINYWYITIDINTTSTDVPILTWDDCDYGMIGMAYSGYYPTTCKFEIVNIAETANHIANFGGGDGGCTGQMKIYQGDGYSGFKQGNNDRSNNAIFVYDEVEDISTGDTVRALYNDSFLFDLDNGISAGNVAFTQTVITQSDGRAYAEVSNAMFYDDAKTKIYRSEHIYKPMYDYDSAREKTIVINGIKMNKMNGNPIYLPVE